MPKFKKVLVPNKETLCRMSFLYQASMLMAKNTALSAYYGRQCRNIGKKAQLRMSPDLKRDLCQRCSLAQQPDITTDLEIKPRKVRKSKNPINNKEAQHTNLDIQAGVSMKCRKCGYKRTFFVNPDYTFWLENPASIVEEIVNNEIVDTPKDSKDQTQKPIAISETSSESLT